MDIEFAPAADSFARVIRTRRTINDFLPTVPPLELLFQAIDLARWAPNHKMTQPWRFHLLGSETRNKIIELNTELLTAQKGADVAEKKRERWQQIPGWLMMTCARCNDPVREEEDYAAVCCAIQNLTLFLWANGVGTKWSTGAVLQDARVASLLSLNAEADRIVGLIWYGYPARVPETKRQPVPEITIIHP